MAAIPVTAIDQFRCLRRREITNQLLAKHTGQKLDKVEKDVERDFIMNAQQAKEYGIIDDIIYKTR